MNKNALFLAGLWLLNTSAHADPTQTAWKRYDCLAQERLDTVLAQLGAATTSCDQAMTIYFACQIRWVNNPEMEQAAVNRCEAATRPLGKKQTERYEMAREACEARFQSRDMRILWSAVRDCKVRLAWQWARRHPAK